MNAAAEALGEKVGVAQACRALGVPRSSLYRTRKPQADPPPRPTPPRALSAAEKATVRAVLNSERFYDSAPRQIYATLLDEDRVYLCHWRTMYRVLQEHEEVHERRKQRRHPQRVKPELRATAPHQVWSWDITQLKGADRCYYLYKVVDVFSRYVVGWMIARHESGELAKKLIAATCSKQGIREHQLTLHADRGSAMRAKTLKEMLKELGIAESHSRPYTPTDNPYSEAQFKTMKYRPNYPGNFIGITEARRWTRGFVQWYNHEHHHTSLALMTPATVHHNRVTQVTEQRQRTLAGAYAAHPGRFVGGPPTPPDLPQEVWINQPREAHDIPGHIFGPVASKPQPDAQSGSRAKSPASLDPDEHLPTIERALVPVDNVSVFLPILVPELSQSH